MGEKKRYRGHYCHLCGQIKLRVIRVFRGSLNTN